MKKLLLAASTAVLVVFTGMSTALAQENRPGLYPVEMWACSFNDRMDQGDMDDVYEMFSENPESPYGAWQLDPFMVGNRDEGFDFIYVGIWQSGNDMGSMITGILSGEDETVDPWNETVTCSAFLYTGINIHAAAMEEDGHYLVSIADCNAEKGVSNGQAVNGIRRYSDYLVENGQTQGRAVWFPRHGNGDADFDFKRVTIYSGPQDWGDAWQWQINNQAVQQRRNFMNGVVSCDESRLYSTRTIMDNLVRQ